MALVLRSDTSLLSESEKRRIAATLIDNVTLCASILTAEKIILGMAFDRPFLIHQKGHTLSGPVDFLSGVDLAWTKDLFRIQQTILPKEYTQDFYDQESAGASRLFAAVV